MFFQNLGLGQFIALFGAVSAISVVLYLLDRSRRKVVVSTLRFWTAADQPTAVQRRRHIQQPLSLILQLLAMLLLILAISQLRVGTEAGAPKRHVLILETSAWMASRQNGQTLMDTARTRARAYLRAIPSQDQVMLIRADALATPATPFESDHRKLEQAIAESEPSSGSLNIEQALSVARSAQANGKGRGEIVFVGSGRSNESPSAIQKTANLRVLPVGGALENLGLRKVGLKRSESDPGVWDILASVRNYGSRPKEAVVSAVVSGVPAGAQRLMVLPGEEREASFTYRTKAPGILKLRLLPNDQFPNDNNAQVEIPADQPLDVTVYSDSPEQLKPILAANPRVTATYKPASQYSAKDKGIVILDRFRPEIRPAAASIWVDPPAANSPIPVRARIANPSQLRWITDNAIGSGLRTRDVHLAGVSVFNAAPDDLKVAEVDGGPIVVARPASPKLVVVGFQPGAMRYELATPLLFANILRWMEPDTFVEKQVNTQPVGTVNVSVARGTDPSTIRVLGPDGAAIPFTVEGNSVHFFSGTPGTVRVLEGSRESIYSLSLPELADGKWTVPDDARKGLPSFRDTATSRDIWQGLAVLAGAILAFEWFRWGRSVKRIAPTTAELKRAA